MLFFLPNQNETRPRQGQLRQLPQLQRHKERKAHFRKSVQPLLFFLTACCLGSSLTLANDMSPTQSIGLEPGSGSFLFNDNQLFTNIDRTQPDPPPLLAMQLLHVLRNIHNEPWDSRTE